MQETPPYSVVEIRILLSQYLDGALEPEQVMALDDLLARFAQYQEEFLKLKTARDVIHGSLEKVVEGPAQLHYTKVSDSTWKNIASRLEEDRQALAAQYDPEFISAYYDGEIPAIDAGLQAFERQLYANEAANRQLAEFGQVSEAVRQLSYRLENSCTVDLTEQVMTAFLQESQSQNAANLPDSHLDLPIDHELALLSAYTDQELTPRETIEANRLIESSEAARSTLSSLNWLSEQIQAISQQLQAQAPDFWLQLEPILGKTLDEGGIVVPFNARKQVSRILRIAVPTAAAVLVIMLAGTRLDNPHIAGKTTNVNGMQLASYQANGSTTLSPLGAEERQFRFDSQEHSMDMSAVMHTKQMSPRPLKPVFEPSPKIAVKPGTIVTDGQVAGDRTPSSEEYLFDALNEQMPAEDISNILGK